MMEPPFNDLVHVQQANAIQTSNPTIDIQAENDRLKVENRQLRVDCEKLRRQNQKIHQELLTLKRLYDLTDRSYTQRLLKLEIREQKNFREMGLFGRFVKVFGVQTINRLKKIDSSRKRDSSFILECMKIFCANDEQLMHASACGRMNKTNFPPEKRKILDDIFIERLAMEQIDDIEVHERYFRLNELINNAINNIIRVSLVVSDAQSCGYNHSAIVF